MTTKDNTMLRVLITQKNEDGSVKEINGTKLEGGVILDRIGEKLGYVYDQSVYDNNYNRKPEFFGKNWYDNDEK